MINPITKYVIDARPDVAKSNTEVIIAVIEEVARRKREALDYETWMTIKTIMRTKGLLPETVVRDRRVYTKSTEEQRAKEVEIHEEYSPSNPSNG